MNECMVMSQQVCGVVAAGDAFSLPTVLTSDETAKRQMSATANAIITAVYGALETLVLGAIEKRTAADFQAYRAQVYSAYYGAVLALPPVLKVLPGNSLDAFVRESCYGMEADLREHGLKFFGAAVRDQAMFTVWTLRKISELINQVPREKTNISDPKSKSGELLKNFIEHGIWARFHLHCIVASIQVSKPMFPATLDVIVDGLRATVNAYAYARQLVDILAPRVFPVDAPQAWDDEDEALLSEATIDMVPEEN
jgi:hypothetical protein